MSAYLQRARTLDSYWRSVILFGQNVASYKFALAKYLIDVSTDQNTFIPLEQLAVPFSRHVAEHLKGAPKQTTSRSSRFLDSCKQLNDGSLSQEQLIQATVALGFNNVIDAFHIVN